MTITLNIECTETNNNTIYKGNLVYQSFELAHFTHDLS